MFSRFNAIPASIKMPVVAALWQYLSESPIAVFLVAQIAMLLKNEPARTSQPLFCRRGAAADRIPAELG
jgi:hypothetical protein